jgi:hypothetical protein
MRFDSLQVQLFHKLEAPVSIACNLFRSPVREVYTVRDYAVNGGNIIERVSTVEWPTPLHSFLIVGKNGDFRQLIAPGQTEWFHFNDASSQTLELLFEDTTFTMNPDLRTQLPLFVSGIIYFECAES